MVESQIRQLARLPYYQELYHASKSIDGINLFSNVANFSGLQKMFLYWVRVYAMLYEELSTYEWENLDEAVINDDTRCDAFLYWRSKHIEKDMKKMKREERKNKTKQPSSMKIFSGLKNKEGIK
jgi:hypothetical protein